MKTTKFMDTGMKKLTKTQLKHSQAVQSKFPFPVTNLCYYNKGYLFIYIRKKKLHLHFLVFTIVDREDREKMSHLEQS